jgi:hypothetical protein
MTSRVTITEDDGIDRDYLVPDDVAQIFLSVSIERDELRGALQEIKGAVCTCECPEVAAAVLAKYD